MKLRDGGDIGIPDALGDRQILFDDIRDDDVEDLFLAAEVVLQARPVGLDRLGYHRQTGALKTIPAEELGGGDDDLGTTIGVHPVL